jgi:glycosyltransferase involved in cell wall biosynthesis
MLLDFIALATGIIYAAVVGLFFWGWKRLIPFRSKSIIGPKVSVIIAARNEEQNLAHLLSDISEQSYPQELIECIVVDDHSTDGTVSSISSLLGVKVVSLPKSLEGKKQAVKLGIESSSGEILLFTDADCRVSIRWIETIVSFFAERKPLMVLAPVLATSKSRIGKCLELEWMSLQASTAGSVGAGYPVMCNAANLAFARQAIPNILSIYDNNNIKSGDDMFALIALKRQSPGSVQYLKSRDALVVTSLPTSLRTFLHQRTRWAAKAKFYNDWQINLTALLVAFVNLFLASLFVNALVSNHWSPLLLLLLVKSVVDFPFLLSVSRFFQKSGLMFWFPVVQSFYFLYVSFTALFSLFIPKYWKGRKIKQ